MKIGSSNPLPSSGDNQGITDIYQFNKNFKNGIKDFTTHLEHLIANPDTMNQENLTDLADKIKQLHSQATLAQNLPKNTDLGQSLTDASTIILNTLEAPIDVQTI